MSDRRRPLRLACIRFTPAPPHNRTEGLLGFVSCELAGAIVLDGLAIRRTSDGRATLSFPRRLDRAGFEHALIRPLNDSVRRAFERQVFDAVRFEPALEGLLEWGMEAAE